MPAMQVVDFSRDCYCCKCVEPPNPNGTIPEVIITETKRTQLSHLTFTTGKWVYSMTRRRIPTSVMSVLGIRVCLGFRVSP
jgi:hypothetical protein